MPMTESYPEDLLKTVQQMGHDAWYFRPDLFREGDIRPASYPARSMGHFVCFILVITRHFLRHENFPTDLSRMKTIPDIHGGRLEFTEGPPRV